MCLFLIVMAQLIQILPHSAKLGIQLVLDSCKSCTCKLGHGVVLFPGGDHPPARQVSCRSTKKGVFFRPNIFQDPKFFRTQNFFGLKIFFDLKFFGSEIFQGPQIFLEPKFFWTQNFFLTQIFF